MELMYKPGDKVMIRPDLSCHKVYAMLSGRHNGEDTYNVVDQMVDQAGKIFTIKGPRAGERGVHSERDRLWLDRRDVYFCLCQRVLL